MFVPKKDFDEFKQKMANLSDQEKLDWETAMNDFWNDEFTPVGEPTVCPVTGLTAQRVQLKKGKRNGKL